MFDEMNECNVDYGMKYKPTRIIKVVKKDGSTEEFNVAKVINAVAKSAYRALTNFTEEEKKHICDFVVQKVNEIGENEIPIPIMQNFLMKKKKRFVSMLLKK